MRYEVLWSDGALSAASAYLGDDRDGLVALFDAVDQLTVDPRPAEAFAWGGDRWRLRVGRYRVIYEVVERTVTIVHLGRSRW